RPPAGRLPPGAEAGPAPRVRHPVGQSRPPAPFNTFNTEKGVSVPEVPAPERLVRPCPIPSPSHTERPPSQAKTAGKQGQNPTPGAPAPFYGVGSMQKP